MWEKNGIHVGLHVDIGLHVGSVYLNMRVTATKIYQHWHQKRVHDKKKKTAIVNYFKQSELLKSSEGNVKLYGVINKTKTTELF